VRSVGLNPTTIPTVNPITGYELVVYELPKIEMVTGGISTKSVEGSRNLGVGMGGEEPVSTSVFTEDNDDSLGVGMGTEEPISTGVGMGTEEPVPTSIFTEDSDDDEPIIRFKRTVKTTPQSTLKPGLKSQRKTTTTPNVTLNTLPYRCQIRISGPAPILPLPKDTVDSPTTKKKTVRKTPLQAPLKTPAKTPPRPVPSKDPAPKRQPQNSHPNRRKSVLNPEERKLKRA